MKIREIVKAIDAKVLVAEEKQMDIEVSSACASDMMSDVLAFVKEQAVLVTGLVNPQVVRTAEMMDMKCIVFARGKMPDKLTLELAETKGIIVMVTALRLYTVCGILYNKGLDGGEDNA